MTVWRRVATSVPLSSTGADRRAPTPHGPLASERPAIPGERRDTAQCRDRLAVQPPALREIGEERAAHDGADKEPSVNARDPS